MKTVAFKIEKSDQIELENWLNKRTIQSGQARIARLLLLLQQGMTYTEICERLGCSMGYISRWKSRYLEQGLSGLYTRHEGRKASAQALKLEAKILSHTQKQPKDGSTHWSTRKMAKELGIDHMTVARTWQKHGIKPHLSKSYMYSDDPDFEAKAIDIIGLYLNPPQHAVVFSVDEKSAIQALDRKDPVLPLSPGRVERHGFEYYRHGTLSLYAAFNIKDGTIYGKTTERHTSQEFLSFIQEVQLGQESGQEIHIILDNLSAHKTKKVKEYLEDNPNIKFHYTPTYSSWLNQVELWFAKIERDLIHRGVFTSKKDLSKKIMRYIKKYNEDPKMVKWKYCNPKKRINILPN